MKTLKRLSLALVLLAACVATGCTNLEVGRPINKAKVDEIIPGATTKEDIRSDAWFGTPLHTVAGPDGEIWVYRYMSGGGRVEELTIGFSDETVACFYKE